MSVQFTLNKLFVLLAVIVWAVVAVCSIFITPVPHEVGWVAVGLALFGISFLP